MPQPIIQVENVGKKYILGHQQEHSNHFQYAAIRDVISDKARSFFQRFFRSDHQPNVNLSQEEFWALKGISFEINQGEAVGIIGRNGAGKSTLLKVLSRITEPTEGKISINGRVASLLEVGTGFHPELTGRENIYLNGAVLGMSQAEIKRKFDEIVAFAEIEKFLDTPVKRYSSGMYVRLAFAVAAHLEPEILIVDEVLAVGDSSFQKKCLGKMEDVTTKQGRTVLFVSHNMQAMAQLTQRCILLSNGQVQFNGKTDQAVKLYLSAGTDTSERKAIYEAPNKKSGNYVASARVLTSEENGTHFWGQPITFEFSLNVIDPHESLRFSFQIVNALQQAVCIFWSFDPESPFCKTAGNFLLRCEIPKLRLYMGSYTLKTWFSDRRGNMLLENLKEICPFEVTMGAKERLDYLWENDECTYLEDAVWNVSKNDFSGSSISMFEGSKGR